MTVAGDALNDATSRMADQRACVTFDAVVCGSGTPGLRTVESAATLRAPSCRCRTAYRDEGLRYQLRRTTARFA